MPSSSKNTTRRFVITNFNLNSEAVYEKHQRSISYLAYGLETCPTTKRPHHQSFLYFKNQRDTGNRALHTIAKMFCIKDTDRPPHVEPMHGDFHDNEQYCSKESTLIELGVRPSQGARTDLLEIKDKIMNGETNVDDLTIDNPILYHQYGRTLEKIETIALRKRFRNWMTSGEWLYGPTGTGKSHRAFESFSQNTHYVKDLETKWWDGYKGQPIVILEDFRGQLPLSTLLRLVDRYPLTVPVRCKESVPFLAQKVIVTSSKHPIEVYYNCGENLDQIVRRFDIVEIPQKSSEGNTETSEGKPTKPEHPSVH